MKKRSTNNIVCFFAENNLVFSKEYRKYNTDVLR